MGSEARRSQEGVTIPKLEYVAPSIPLNLQARHSHPTSLA